MLLFNNILKNISKSRNYLNFSFILILLGIFYLNSNNLNESSESKKNLIKTTEKYNNISDRLYEIENYLIGVREKVNNISKIYFLEKSQKKTNDVSLISDNKSIEENIDSINKEVENLNSSLDYILKSSKKEELSNGYIPAIIPIEKKYMKRIASGFGVRYHPILGIYRNHNGIDFAAPVGTPVYATAKGVVVKSGFSGGLGNVVIIKHSKTYSTLYAHLAFPKKGKRLPRVGKRINRADEIGNVGNTGLSTGPHLHYEVHKNGMRVDPLGFFLANETARDFKEIRKIARNAARPLD